MKYYNAYRLLKFFLTIKILEIDSPDLERLQGLLRINQKVKIWKF